MMIILTWWRSFTYKEKIYLRLAFTPCALLLIVLFLLSTSHTQVFHLPCSLSLVPRPTSKLACEENGTRKEDTIRFHVLAHSNSFVDQRVKNMVRDATLHYLSPMIASDATWEEVELLLQREKNNLAEAARQKLWSEGHRQEVQAFFRSIFFPARLHGGKVYPAGEYKALQLIIGEGVGENWWCVLFPPLCLAELVLIRWERAPLAQMTEEQGEKEKLDRGEKEKEAEEEKR